MEQLILLFTSPIPISAPDAAELWKDIPSWEGLYQASTHGRIKSLERIIHRNVSKPGERGSSPTRRWPEAILQTTYKRRYLKVRLWRNQHPTDYNVHRLILLAFMGEPPPGQVACHNDGDPYNNRLENLRWDTMKSNHADRDRHGKAPKGTRNGNAKLTEEQVLAIRDDDRQYAVIAQDHDITDGNVSHIKSRRAWKHL